MRFSSCVKLRLVILAVTTAAGAAGNAHGQIRLRYQTQIAGNVVLVGNTLAQDVSSRTRRPVAGDFGQLGAETQDAAPDVFWRSNWPQPGVATADASFEPTSARSQAMLSLPGDSHVVYARVYWASMGSSGVPRTHAELRRGSERRVSITADGLYEQPTGHGYVATADVTELVREWGAGPFELGGIDGPPLANLYISESAASGWTLAVVFERRGDTVRDVMLADGIAMISVGEPAQVILPRSNPSIGGQAATLGVFALGASDQFSYSSIAVNGFGIRDTANPSGQVFNSSRSRLGEFVSVEGDLPRLAGSPWSMSGVDIDEYDITPVLSSWSTNFDTRLSVPDRGGFMIGLLSASIPVQCDRAVIARRPPGRVAVCPGGTARIGILAEGSYLRYQWRRDGIPLRPDDRFSGITTPQLLIIAAEADDTGLYDCVVTNPCTPEGVVCPPSELLLCAAERNCDGFLDFFDYDDFVHSFETGIGDADFNGDGFVDFFDYDGFVAAFEAGC